MAHGCRRAGLLNSGILRSAMLGICAWVSVAKTNTYQDLIASLKEAYDKAAPIGSRAPDLKALRKIYDKMEEQAPTIQDSVPFSHFFWRLQADTADKLRLFDTVESAVRRAVQNPGCLDDKECFLEMLNTGIVAAHRRGDGEAARSLFELGKKQDGGRGRMPWRGPDQLAKTVVLDKPSKAFFTPEEVPLAAALEKAFPDILRELEGIMPVGPPPARFVGTVDALAREAGAKGDSYARKRAEDFLVNARDLCHYEDANGPRLPDDQPCWEETSLYAAGKVNSKRGMWLEEHCALAPNTCEVLQSPEVIGDVGLGHLGIPGKAGFIVLHPNSRILAHSGDHNARLTVHLGLRIPEGTFIEVRGERKSWKAGQAIVLDDSYIHWVSNPSAEDRVILLAHVWHPNLVQAKGGFRPGPGAVWEGASRLNQTASGASERGNDGSEL